MRSATVVYVALAAWMLSLVALPAEAGTPYVAARVGYTMPRDTDAGLLNDLHLQEFASLSASYGEEIDRGYAQFRLEGELSYRENQLADAQFLGNRVDADGHVRATALMANAFCIVETSTFVKPYGMVGLGGAWVTMDNAKAAGVVVVDDSHPQYAYQVGGGLELTLSERVSLDVEYRYFATSRDEFTDELGDDFSYQYRTHEVALGLRYRF
jgi:opacity protein-like surface antigen